MEITLYVSNRGNLPQGIWLMKYWKTEKVKTLRQNINNYCRMRLPHQGEGTKAGLSEPTIIEKGPA